MNLGAGRTCDMIQLSLSVLHGRGAARVGVNDMGLEERVKTQERHFARGSLEPVSLSLSLSLKSQC